MVASKYAKKYINKYQPHYFLAIFILIKIRHGIVVKDMRFAFRRLEISKKIGT